MVSASRPAGPWKNERSPLKWKVRGLMRPCQIIAGGGRGNNKKRAVCGKSRSITEASWAAKRWSPRARLLFIVGASVALWLLIALIMASIW